MKWGTSTCFLDFMCTAYWFSNPVLSLPASLLKLQYKSYINEQHSSRKKWRLEGGGGEGKKKRDRKGKQEFTGFLDLNTYFHRNTKTYLILIYFLWENQESAHLLLVNMLLPLYKTTRTGNLIIWACLSPSLWRKNKKCWITEPMNTPTRKNTDF